MSFFLLIELIGLTFTIISVISLYVRKKTSLNLKLGMGLFFIGVLIMIGGYVMGFWQQQY